MAQDTRETPTDKAMKQEDDEYHHHVISNLDDFLFAKDYGAPLKAKCGKMVYPKANPIAHPCCPGCRSQIKRCIAEEAS